MRLLVNLLLNLDRILLLLPLGAIWILQGVGVLPGSFMSGHIIWTVIGAILFALEAFLVVVTIRRMRA